MANRRKVLLVGWDAADWKVIHPLLDRGEMPVLGGIVNGGASGNLESLVPMLSPMLWTSIATGKRPYQHGIIGFTEIDPELGIPTMMSSAARRCRALWQILGEQGLRTHAVGWFITHPAEPLHGVCVSDRFATPAPAPGRPWPMDQGTVCPEALAEVLANLRVRPEEIGGDVLAGFVPRAAEVNQAQDRRLYQLAKALAECFSVHNAATHLLEHEPWDFAAVYYRAIDSIGHHFMEFHPPRMTGRDEAEFERYRHVMTSAYRLQDAMLGRLLELAGEDTTVLVVSDHGFHSDHLRPAILPNVTGGVAEWHRPSGVLAMRGAGLRRDALLHGASLLDITPTILALYGLPTGRDMDGRVLAEAFAEPPPLATVDTWDPAGGPPARPSAAQAGRSAAREWAVVQQFFELGYVENPGDNSDGSLSQTRSENDWNLARSYLGAGRVVDALPLLESIAEDWPERWDYAFTLARCQLNLDLYEEALETATALTGPRFEAANRLLLANIEYRRGHYPACLEHLLAVEAINPRRVDAQVQIGRTRALLRQWEPAEAAFRRALEINPDEPRGYLGLAHCHLHAKDFEGAAEAALHAVGLRFDLPLGHFYLGIALARLGEIKRATEAFETCVHFQPGWTAPRRFLVILYARRPDGAEKARGHRESLAAHPPRPQEQLARQAQLRREVAARAHQRAEARAARRAGQTPVETPLSVARPDDPAGSAPLDFLIVSGLPRSGTSLMMQMLVAGGLAPMCDELRPADDDNPRGYFEWQEIKGLPKNPRLIEQAHGRVTKVISMLLPSLPPTHRYKVIFMVRPVEEMLASQERMRHRLRRGGTTPSPGPEVMEAELRRHRERILDWLRARANFEVLEVDYPSLIDEPQLWSERVAAFACLEPDRAALMAATVAPELRHGQLEAASDLQAL